MGFRPRNTIMIFPGISVNLGSADLFESRDMNGVKVAFGKKGMRKTIGIPGTGLSYTVYKKYDESPGAGTSDDDGDEFRSFFLGCLAALGILSIVAYLAW